MKLMTTNETKGTLISIVDDEECVRESLSSLVRSAGYDTDVYVSAEDFLARGRWDETACTILDVRLPGMGGLELQRHLEKVQRERPVVFISGHATDYEQTWAMTNGATAFLKKPFSDDMLLKAVQELVTRGVPRDFGSGKPHNQVCPSCHELAQVAGIPEYLVPWFDDIHASTVEMIETLRPGWAERDGLCEPCWRFYVRLGRIVNFLRGPDTLPKTPGESNLTAGVRLEG
jgi:CheY-like chemotaxis protein